jgi:hypothetical protein
MAIRTTGSLRRLLFVDAFTCALFGGQLLLLTDVLSRWTNIPAAIMQYAGFALLPIALTIAAIAALWAHVPSAVWAVAIGNAGWVVASAWLVVGGVVQPNMVGTSFVAGQAALVAVFAWAEARGAHRLHRAPSNAAAPSAAQLGSRVDRSLA